jgi:hypothetical protein
MIKFAVLWFYMLSTHARMQARARAHTTERAHRGYPTKNMEIKVCSADNDTCFRLAIFAILVKSLFSVFFYCRHAFTVDSLLF